MSSALLDRGRVEIKLADYGVAPATALTDSLLLGRTQDYRRAAASRLYPLEGSAINEKIPSAEFHVSRKIDGEFTVLVFRQGEAFTLNPGGTVRVVESSPANFKVTTPYDLQIAEHLLADRLPRPPAA